MKKPRRSTETLSIQTQSGHEVLPGDLHPLRDLHRGLPRLCQSMGQVQYISAYRHEIVRRIYKKYFKGQGKAFPAWGESKELTDMALQELSEAAYSCTGCRRCMVYCPYGIDTQMLMSIAKLLSGRSQYGAGDPVHAGRHVH